MGKNWTDQNFRLKNLKSTLMEFLMKHLILPAHKLKIQLLSSRSHLKSHSLNSWRHRLLTKIEKDDKFKHKPTNVRRIALEREARQFNSWSLVMTNFSLCVQTTSTPPWFQPLTSRSMATRTNHCATSQLIFRCCNRIYISNKLYFGALEITKKWWTKAWKSHLRSQRMFYKKSAKFSSEKFA